MVQQNVIKIWAIFNVSLRRRNPTILKVRSFIRHNVLTKLTIIQCLHSYKQIQLFKKVKLITEYKKIIDQLNHQSWFLKYKQLFIVLKTINFVTLKCIFRAKSPFKFSFFIHFYLTWNVFFLKGWKLNRT